MKQTQSKFLLFLAFGFLGLFTNAQQRFDKEINEFIKADSSKMPPENAVVLIGSSSFTIWKDVQNYFPESEIINRGFGGSTIPEVVYYLNDVALKYKPKQVLIYCGENDLVDEKISAEIVWDRAVQLMKLLRGKLGEDVVIIYVSIKPSPSRRHLRDKVIKTNELIKEQLDKDPYVHYVDVYSLMLNEDGTEKGELFQKDSLHMLPEGYELWKKALEPYIMKKDQKKLKIKKNVPEEKETGWINDDKIFDAISRKKMQYVA